MYDVKSYVPPFAIGHVLEGPALGCITESTSDQFTVGDIVYSDFGWREDFVADADKVESLELGSLPPQAFLGVAGIPGLTAYVGLLHIAELKPDDVVFISAASGAVGSMACQIAKNIGCKVIASAGGEEKVAFLKDKLSVDEVIDYKSVKSLTKALATAAPEGIDVYFDNVGGEHLQAAIGVANRFARFALCGMISQYNLTTAPAVPKNLMLIMGKALRLQGFIVTDYDCMKADFYRDLFRWHEDGRLNWTETIFDGLEKTPEALVGLFKGANMGKMLIKL
jgi:NADPH-dependent curcumin reductase CurA